MMAWEPILDGTDRKRALEIVTVSQSRTMATVLGAVT
jgi:hypothetical protein